MLVTPDDFLELNQRAFRPQASLGPDHSIQVFDKLVEHIEPHLLILDGGGAVAWYQQVVLTRSELTMAGSGARASPALQALAELAVKYWKLTGAQPQRKLDFMQNSDLRRVAEDDWTRLVAAGQREDAKTTAIAARSVVEAIALDVIERLPRTGADKLRDHLNALVPDRRMNLRPANGPPPKWTFAFLLLAVGPQGLKVLTDRTHVVGHTLRDWRNLVHPNEARFEQPLSAADGRLAAGFAEKVIEDVDAWSVHGGNLVVP